MAYVCFLPYGLAIDVPGRGIDAQREVEDHLTKETLMNSEPKKEHQWLDQLVGEWASEMEAVMEPGQPPSKHTGIESVRSLQGIWVVCEGRGEVPEGGSWTTIMTLGYDPAKGRYLGTFIGSMMTHMWLYEGQLDAAEKVLTLDTEGPSPTDEGKTSKYKDVIEIKSSDHRVLTSNFLADDGTWREFMTATYRRIK
jgi:Protein of unknown function (DUF1579)